uniref:Septin 9b n=1 Tax=Tetraodon nigroviridis TaxID=99883 RepID=H3CDK6_TETNG
SAALKRSFEVEDVDTSSHSSPGSRRTNNSPHRNAMSPTSIYYRELGAPATANNNNVNYSQPRSIMGGGGSRTPEPVSRRSELNIDISSSSKHVDNATSPASSRFGSNSALKRPEVLGHSKTPEMGHRREVTFAKTPNDSPVIRRHEGNNNNNGAGRPPEQNYARKFEPPSPGDVRRPDRKLKMHDYGANSEGKGGAKRHENSSAALPQIEALLPPLSLDVDINSAPPSKKSLEGSEVSLSHSTMSESGKPSHANLQMKGDKSHGGEFGYVGIDAILEQMRRKAMKQGFELNLMVVGQSGLGKSTLMNTLFKSKVSRKSAQPDLEERIPKTIEIKSISHDIEEKGVRMKLTVIDTPGFGDQINNENCWQPIMKFINEQYEAYLQEEIHINRKKRIPDTRVHCCIYFIPPTGHCLRPLDVEFMRRLSKVVNIVPVIAKADTLTLEERDFFKQTIREELRANGIDVYPQKEFDEDAEDRLINEKIREMIPFAVVGSDQEYQVNGKRILGRKTKWGTIEVENIAHCEFAYLRDLLIRTHMQNIKDITSNIHYETYRVRRLNESNGHFSTQPPDHAA